MEKAKRALEELISAISDTEVCKEYMRAKKSITKDELERINEYKELKKASLNSGSNEDAIRAESLYTRLMLNVRMRRYIINEKKLSELIVDIYDKIGSRIIEE